MHIPLRSAIGEALDTKQEAEIGHGDHAISTTVQHMAQIINLSSKNPLVREWARTILAGVMVNAKHDEAQAIHNFVRDHIRYTRDPYGWEYIQTPPVLLGGIEEYLKRRAARPIGDCVTGDVKVIVRHKPSQQYELKKIEELESVYNEYDALSYQQDHEEWQFQPITNWKEQGVQSVYRVKFKNGASVECTLGHKFYNVEQRRGKIVSVDRMKLDDIPFERSHRREPTAKVLCAKQIPCLGKTSQQTEHELWLDGIFVAEGSCGAYEQEGKVGRVAIAQDKVAVRQEIDYHLQKSGIEQYFRKDGDPWYRDHHGMRRGKTEVFRKLGGRSQTKRFRQEHLSMPLAQIEQLLDGYQKGDAHCPIGKHFKTYYKTISKTLFEQLVFLHYVLGRPLWQRVNNGLTVAGNVGYSALEYQHERPTKWRKEIMDGVTQVGIKSVEYIGRKTVYDMTVANTHNFVAANGIILSNCDDMTVLSLSLMKSVGFPVVIKTVGYNGRFSHVYGMVHVNGKWIVTDTVRPDKWFGWEAPGVTRVMEVQA